MTHTDKMLRDGSLAMVYGSSAHSKTQSTVIFINQLREKIGVMFGNP